MTAAPEPSAEIAEPFDLTWHALERIAKDAGAEDGACVHRILLAYWHSPERKARDRRLIHEGRELASKAIV
jgi:hypothetical protein